MVINHKKDIRLGKRFSWGIFLISNIIYYSFVKWNIPMLVAKNGVEHAVAASNTVRLWLPCAITGPNSKNLSPSNLIFVTTPLIVIIWNSTTPSNYLVFIINHWFLNIKLQYKCSSYSIIIRWCVRHICSKPWSQPNGNLVLYFLRRKNLKDNCP